MTDSSRLFKGMTAFWLMWVGQVVSLLGTSMTNFALTIWVYQLTGSATALALMGVFYMTPLVILSPFIGVFVDRYDRKMMMILSDLAAGLVTIGIFVVYLSGNLQIWHLYAAALINGMFSGFQNPAFTAALTMMLPKEQYVRAFSMLQIIEPGGAILAPLLAGALLGLAPSAGIDGLRIILTIDVITFVVAISALLLIHVPAPPRSEESEAAKKAGFWSEVLFGFRYVMARPSLMWFCVVFIFVNFLGTLGAGTLTTPMLLARTNENTFIFGIIQTITSVGMILGGVILGAWGGFKRRIHGVMLGSIASFILWSIVVGLGRPEPLWMMSLWGIGSFFGAMTTPLINSSSRGMTMTKIDPAVQGRVYSATRLLSWGTIPIASILGGTLADYVFEPAMREGGSLVPVFGWLVGSGAGAGMSLMIIGIGILGVLVCAAMYFVPLVRDIETLLPDHDAGKSSDQSPVASTQSEQAAEAEASPA